MANVTIKPLSIGELQNAYDLLRRRKGVQVDDIERARAIVAILGYYLGIGLDRLSEEAMAKIDNYPMDDEIRRLIENAYRDNAISADFRGQGDV